MKSYKPKPVIKCPHCGVEWERKNLNRRRKDIQHHLYMAHHIDVIESHKEANKLCV